jgi:hypothetical protein
MIDCGEAMLEYAELLRRVRLPTPLKALNLRGQAQELQYEAIKRYLIVGRDLLEG